MVFCLFGDLDEIVSGFVVVIMQCVWLVIFDEWFDEFGLLFMFLEVVVQCLEDLVLQIVVDCGKCIVNFFEVEQWCDIGYWL